MSAHLLAVHQPQQRRHQPASSLEDWVEIAALLLMCFSAAVVVATMLAVPIIM